MESARLRSQVTRYQQLLSDCQAISAENELNSSRSLSGSARAAYDVELDRFSPHSGHQESKRRARSTESTGRALGAASKAAEPRIETRTSHLKGVASQTVALSVGQKAPLVARTQMVRSVSPAQVVRSVSPAHVVRSMSPMPRPCQVAAPSMSPGAYILEPMAHAQSPVQVARSPIQTSPCLPAWPAYPDSPTLPRPTNWFVASPQASPDSMAAASFVNQRLRRNVSPVRREVLTAMQPVAQQQPASPVLRSPCSLARAPVAPPVVMHKVVPPAVAWSTAPRVVSSPVSPQLPAAARLARTLREQAAKQLATCLKGLMLRQVASSLARWWRAAEEESLGEYATAAMLSKLAAYDRAARGHDRVGSILSAAMATEGQRAAYHSRTLSVLLGLRQLHTFMERKGQQDFQAAFQFLSTHRPASREITVSFDELAAKNGLRKSVLQALVNDNEIHQEALELSKGEEFRKKRVEFQSREDTANGYIGHSGLHPGYSNGCNGGFADQIKTLSAEASSTKSDQNEAVRADALQANKLLRMMDCE